MWVLTQVEGKVDLVGVLDGFKHGLGLPPRLVFVVVEVGEVLRGMGLRSSGITDLTRLLCARRTRLHAELRGAFFATRVGGLHKHIKGRVLETRYASLRTQHIRYDMVGQNMVLCYLRNTHILKMAAVNPMFLRTGKSTH